MFPVPPRCTGGDILDKIPLVLLRRERGMVREDSSILLLVLLDGELMGSSFRGRVAHVFGCSDCSFCASLDFPTLMAKDRRLCEQVRP